MAPEAARHQRGAAALHEHVFLQAAPFEVKAGEVAWQERVREVFSMLDTLPPTVEIWGESCPVDQTLLDKWCAVTQDLTAGHTTLLDPAVGLFSGCSIRPSRSGRMDWRKQTMRAHAGAQSS